MTTLTQTLKVKLNYWLDRVVDFGDMILVDAYHVPAAIKPQVHGLVRWLGDMCFILQDFPKVTVTALQGCGWRILFLGSPHNLPEIRKMIFGSEEVEEHSVGRVALWNLPQQSKAWLNGEADLIISELSRRSPWQLKGAIRFVIPIWFNMVVKLPDPIESILNGRKRKRARQRVKKGHEAGFEYRFSQAKADFDAFHYRMYIPFVKARHGEGALVSTYEHQWKRWFQRGGLVLVTQNGHSVGGALCYIADGVCHSVEGGILDADPELVEQELNGISDWYTMMWAKGKGAQYMNMGGTRPRRNDGVFLYKRRWGATPSKANLKLSHVWTFAAARHLPESLLERLNAIGLISEIDDQYYGVHIHNEASPLSESVLHDLRTDWGHEGVYGVLVVSGAHPQKRYPVHETDDDD